MTEFCNIAAALPRLAREHPDQIAMRCPGRMGRYGIALTYAQLDSRSDAIAVGFARHGIVSGTRTVVMVRPSPEFFLLLFALFKAGAIPVLIDPGIDRRALKQCLDECNADAFIGIPLAHAARIVMRWARSARIHITTGQYAWAADATLAAVERAGFGASAQLAETKGDDPAAILFTSGSTGVPKGVLYRHRHFAAQIDMLRNAFVIEAGGIDLPTFPPFALFDPALGLTSIIPDMDATRPARANPRKLIRAIERFNVTQLFGSPALMRVLATHGAMMPSIRLVLSAGAPVPIETVQAMQTLLPSEAQFWTPYGATESLPVTAIEGRELIALSLRTQHGAGTCVGRALPSNTVRMIRIDDSAIETWSDELCVKPGQIGEITVVGPSTTDTYFNRDAATRLAKIEERLPDGEVRIVHRMGDLGYVDVEGRVWFCGRKTQRVTTIQGTLCTEQVEPIFNTHPEFLRTALVGIGPPGTQKPVLCVELRAPTKPDGRERIVEELRHMAEGFVHTAQIETFLFHKRFPVDIRHNAKISREILARWAAKQIRQ